MLNSGSVSSAEIYALEKPPTSNWRPVEALMSNGVEVYLPTMEEMVLYLITTTGFSKLAEFDPNGIVIVSYALADRLCSYPLTKALLSSRELRVGRLRVLSPGEVEGGAAYPRFCWGIDLAPYPGLAAVSLALFGGRVPGWFLPPPFGGPPGTSAGGREVPGAARLRACPVPLGAPPLCGCGFLTFPEAYGEAY
ncbi:hypothetical protein [Pyrobaculum calidifontis]|nr:hypothetical protein [Pyrobaculum calidifontis]